MRLDLGAGGAWKQKYINVDIRLLPMCQQADARDLSFSPGSAEQIEAYHLIEHFTEEDGRKALAHWHDLLCAGGKLIIECPDHPKCLEMHEQDPENIDIQRWLEGGHRWPNDEHLHGYSTGGLGQALKEAGFATIKVYNGLDQTRDNCPVLRAEAWKAGARADIVVPCWNHLNLTKQVIQSVRENTSIPYRLIVVDDGSTDGTAEWLALQDDLTVITNESNQGFAPSVNRGLQIAKAPYVVLLNNDVEVDELWLETLIEGMDVRPNVGAIGPLSTARQQIQWEGHHLGKQGVWLGIEYLAFFCTVFRREVIEEVGLLDEGFAPCYGEDDDYAIRVRRAGWELGLHADVLVKHDHGQTTGPAGLAKYHGAAYERLREKWGKKVWVSILNQGEIRPELSELVSTMRSHRLHQVHVEYPSLKSISHNRNSIVKRFLESGFDYLLMIDDDITPSRNPLDLVTLDKDIIGLPCPTWNPAVNPDAPLYWVVMEYVDEQQGMRPALMRNDAGLTRLTAKGKPIDAVGTGAILIARRVLEQVRAPFERFWDEDGVQVMGLDYAFCFKARQMGWEVWVNMDFRCGHWVTLNLWDVDRILNRG